jgi:hypothetical protein
MLLVYIDVYLNHLMNVYMTALKSIEKMYILGTLRIICISRSTQSVVPECFQALCITWRIWYEKIIAVAVVYFQNFAHFDGIMLTRHLVKYHNYKLTPIMINGELYELRVYYNQRHSIVFRDSLKQVGKSAERSVSSCRLRNKECYNKECSEIKPSLV